MQLPPDLHAVLDAVRRVGRPRLVGGCVRDWLLDIEPKDFDVEVPGCTFEQLHRALAPYGSTDIVGRSFGVIKLRLPSPAGPDAPPNEYDFSLPRRESKTGSGHRGFAIAPEPDLTDAEAAARRDFTINSIAYDPFENTLIDPHHGRDDLHARILRHTSPAFTEDPLRVLRAFQLAARFDLTLAPETAALCRSIQATHTELPLERIWAEWAKWAEKSTKPSRGLAVLRETNWITHYPEINALVDCPQDPEWHPEGDVYIHTAHCCDALVRQPTWAASPPHLRLRRHLAVLAHDFGKPPVTAFAERRGRVRWISPGHEAAGGPLADTFLARIGATTTLADEIRPLVQNHLAHHHGSGTLTDARLRRLARDLAPSNIEDLVVVMYADHDGRPPLYSPESLTLIHQLQDRAAQLALADSAPQPILLGRHLISVGHVPSPRFRSLLDAAFEAQLDGAFHDEPSAIEWLKSSTHYDQDSHH